ncbi:hypothetical protein SS50377_24895 [Spironucleus salmonicida]|uniref:Uncharacterized protein n=1 Tax=Spironucleus salmonicida TaxID=348837 RepID=V6LGJ7_9EUKA|nr:hypothetical protein SS50377_24895 [Spironucleus salmonicida]|eukprot:EST43428.1 Hypothetical protein SS50377_16788 [Spironucleus salmonicida]
MPPSQKTLHIAKKYGNVKDQIYIFKSGLNESSLNISQLDKHEQKIQQIQNSGHYSPTVPIITDQKDHLDAQIQENILSIEVASLVTENKALRQIIQEQNNKICSFKLSFTTVQADLQQVQQLNDKLRDKSTESCKFCDSMSKNLEEQIQINQELSKDINQVKDELILLKEQYQLDDNILQGEFQIVQYEQEIKDLQTKIQELESVNIQSNIEQDYCCLQNQINQLEKDALLQVAKKKSLKNQINELLQLNNDYKQIIDQQEVQTQLFRKEMNEYKQIQKAQSQLFQDSLNDKDYLITEVEQELKNQKIQFQEKIDQFKDQLIVQNSENSKLARIQFNTDETTIQDFQIKLEELQMINKQLQENLIQKEQIINSLNSHQKTAHNNSANEQNQLHNVQNVLNTKDKQIIVLQQNINDLDARFDSLQQINNQLQENFSENQKNTSQKDITIQNYAKDLTNLQFQYTEVQKNLAHCQASMNSFNIDLQNYQDVIFQKEKEIISLKSQILQIESHNSKLQKQDTTEYTKSQQLSYLAGPSPDTKIGTNTYPATEQNEIPTNQHIESDQSNTPGLDNTYLKTQSSLTNCKLLQEQVYALNIENLQLKSEHFQAQNLAQTTAQEIELLKNQIEILTNTVNDLNRQNSSFTSFLDTSQTAENSKINKILTSKTAELTALHTENSNLQSQLQIALHQNLQLTQRIEAQEMEIQNQIEKIQFLTQNLNSLKQSETSYIEILSENNPQVLKFELSEAEKRLKSEKLQAQELLKIAEKLQEKLDAKKSKIEILTSENRRFQLQIIDLENQIQLEKMGQNEADFGGFQAKIKLIEEANLSVQRSLLEGDKGSGNEIGVESQNLNAIQKEMENQIVSQFETEINDLKAENENLKQQIDRLEQEIEALRAQNAGLLQAEENDFQKGEAQIQTEQNWELNTVEKAPEASIQSKNSPPDGTDEVIEYYRQQLHEAHNMLRDPKYSMYRLETMRHDHKVLARQFDAVSQQLAAEREAQKRMEAANEVLRIEVLNLSCGRKTLENEAE